MIWSKIQSKLDDFLGKLGLTGLTLATEDGLLLASSGKGIDAEWLAAVCPLLKRSTSDPLRNELDQYGRKGISLNILDVSLGSQSVFLCAAGTENQISDPQLHSLLHKIVHIIND